MFTVRKVLDTCPTGLELSRCEPCECMCRQQSKGDLQSGQGRCEAEAGHRLRHDSRCVRLTPTSRHASFHISLFADPEQMSWFQEAADATA